MPLLRKEGLTAAAIARVLGRSRSTIGRELKRNSCVLDGAYRSSKAQERTKGRRRRCRQSLHHTPWQYVRVELLLAEKWSPEQIASQLPERLGFHLSHMISTATCGATSAPEA